MILDTAFVVALGRGDEGAFSRGVVLAESGEVQWLPVPVIQELEYGVEFTGDDAEQRRARSVCRLYPPVSIDSELARRAGQLLARADLASGDEVGAAGIGTVDAQVAAVADLFDDAVLTDNVKDFEALGIDVETY